MIIRILGERQYAVDEADTAVLNRLDALLLDAADDGDDTGFTEILGQLHAAVHQYGTAVADDELVASDLVMPSPDTDLIEVRALLGPDGLIPG